MALGIGLGAGWFLRPVSLPADTPIVSSPSTAAGAASAVDKSIAVLPFVAMSRGEDDEYFADGLTEEILNVLSALPDLQVTAISCSMR